MALSSLLFWQHLHALLEFDVIFWNLKHKNKFILWLPQIWSTQKKFGIQFQFWAYRFEKKARHLKFGVTHLKFLWLPEIWSVYKKIWNPIWNLVSRLEKDQTPQIWSSTLLIFYSCLKFGMPIKKHFELISKFGLPNSEKMLGPLGTSNFL